MRITLFLILVATLLSVSLSTVFGRNQLYFPGIKYGNYCGLGHSSETLAEPIDALDRLCQIHDICVTQRGLFDCYCNMQLYYGLAYENGTMRPFGNDTANNHAYHMSQTIYLATALCGKKTCDYLPLVLPAAKYGIYSWMPLYDIKNATRMYITTSFTLSFDGIQQSAVYGSGAYVITTNGTTDYFVKNVAPVAGYVFMLPSVVDPRELECIRYYEL